MRMVRHLGREDWIAAGLAALAGGGAAAFRVEAVARSLGVSKGSFYWHFRDRADWRDAVLGWWEHRAFAALARSGRRAAPGAGPARQAARDIAVEAMLRDWGRADVSVALCLQRVAAERRLAAAARGAAAQGAAEPGAAAPGAAARGAAAPGAAAQRAGARSALRAAAVRGAVDGREAPSR